MPKETGAGVHEFIEWALSSNGQDMAKPLFYAPLPASVAKRALAISKTMTLK
jgi:ABC-type phosphate transport system substrate-binding protein